MRHSTWTVIVLGLLVLFIIAPFSGLAVLMLLLVAAAIMGIISTLVQGVLPDQDR